VAGQILTATTTSPHCPSRQAVTVRQSW